METLVPPGPRQPTDPARFTSADGTALYGEWFAADGPAAALVVHGYAEHCGRYREVAGVLTGLGLPTFTFDLRGHGRSDGARGHVSAYDDYLADIEAALAELGRRAGAAASRVLLVCHSNGGLASLRLLADPFRCPPAIRAAVISSPLLGVKVPVPRIKRLAAATLGRALPSLSFPLHLDPAILTHDPDKLAERRVDTLCHDVASARWFNGMLGAQEWVAAYAHRVAIPTLWLIGADDQLCDAEAARRVASTTPRAEVHMLAGMFHEVFNERERGHAFALMAGFVGRAVLG